MRTTKIANKQDNRTTAKSTKRKTAATSSRSRAKKSQAATRYAVPAAVMLGTGALTAAGVVMRERLGEVLGTAVAEGMSLAKDVSFAKMLGLMGVERRRSFFSRAIPGLGGLVIGLASGAAIAAAFFAERPERARIDAAAPRAEPIAAANHQPIREPLEHAPFAT